MTAMSKPLRLGLPLFLVLSCVGCDQVTKKVAEAALAEAAPLSLADGMVRFQLITNRGGFLSLGAELPKPLRTALFTLGAPLLLGALLLYQLATVDLTRTQVTGFALLLGGGIGNLIDRVSNDGGVTDFVSVGIGPLRTGIFNVADVAILAGVALALWSMRPTAPRSPAD